MASSSSQNRKVGVLFSGGRDSSLAACLLALERNSIYLLTCDSGITIKDDLADYRYNELKSLFPKEIVSRTTLRTVGLFRRIAIASIESDFAEYRNNLILLGNKLAMHAEATVFCLTNNIHVLADGSNRYQRSLPEQMLEAIDKLKEFEREYGIDYVTPVWEYDSEDAVKYRLLDLGISTKSLEGITIFAGSFSTPSPETVVKYIRDKLPICHQHIAFKMRTGRREEQAK